jgi:hypothetical protein
MPWIIVHKIDLFLDQEIVTAIAEPNPIPLFTNVLLVEGIEDCANTAIVQHIRIVKRIIFLFIIYFDLSTDTKCR